MPELSDYRKMVQCERCLEVFSADLETCPVCGSDDLIGYKIQNPFSRLPMERVLYATGHLMWMIGLVGCLFLLWNTNSDDSSRNWMFACAGFGVLLFSMVMSVTLFGLGEMLKRMIRIQRRVRAFMQDYVSNE
ncbi:hypothetical protein GO013_04715 [Pseudodesulfovibrio sp. JC047]|uniref:hypothetical protein n=1 Tax=Pseudodesulfovibrio sp. JC047 TaxID=2683199 RepID=UPI0013CF7C8D|nr:hypothetical protein [Pseudodesulfovibrio sp. JC047]NDV18721.1 hypothetical protein [Pseudodesulfovibrio sp. JC047]